MRYLGIDAVLLDPVIINQRRARMLRRPPDYANGFGHCSRATRLRSTPIAGHSISSVSPGFNHCGGSVRFNLTGVPVAMMSPGFSVMNVLT